MRERLSDISDQPLASPRISGAIHDGHHCTAAGERGQLCPQTLEADGHEHAKDELLKQDLQACPSLR